MLCQEGFNSRKDSFGGLDHDDLGAEPLERTRKLESDIAAAYNDGATGTLVEFENVPRRQHELTVDVHARWHERLRPGRNDQLVEAQPRNVLAVDDSHCVSIGERSATRDGFDTVGS